MNLITENYLIGAGYEPGTMLNQMLVKAVALHDRGIHDRKYVLKLLAREFGAPPPKVVMREKPLPLAEAIHHTNREEYENLQAVRQQMRDLLKVPVISRGAVMPDACPTGKGRAVMPVGGVIAAKNAIIPSAHSSDICCSMFATFYHERSDIGSELDVLETCTRFGLGHRHLDTLVEDPVHDEDVWGNPFLQGLRDRARVHMADQGDGNHFAFIGELDVDAGTATAFREAGHVDLADQLTGNGRCRVLVTHHGSRGLGAHVYKRGHIAALKHVEKIGAHIPDAGAWLEADSAEGQAYWEALQYVARWTRANHAAIHRRFLERIGAPALATLNNEHNFVWKRGDTFLHGKGATPAWKDELGRPLAGLIPLNMAEPVLIVLGGDNADFLSFAPHGAGRNLSRTALRRQFHDESHRQETIRRTTQGLDIRWFCGKPDLSETPVAYKNAGRIREQIARFGLARIIGEIQPLGCIMAGATTSWRAREDELTPKQIRQIAHRSERRRVKQDLSDEY
jgi:tRNA-splicing ligase RtcB